MPIADMYAGIHGVAAVCAALVGRNVSGRGQHIDTALYDCMIGMHDFAVQCYTMSGGKELPVQTGHDLPQATVYGVFPARDGNVDVGRLLRTGAISLDDLNDALDWVRSRSALYRGALLNTILRNDTFFFSQLGTFLERADNTARLLDVKFHARNTEFFGSGVGNESKEVDFYHWSAVLRSVSAFEVYRKVYRNVIRPEKVAELLILRAEMPRSLVFCMDEVVSNLRAVANDHSHETIRRAGRLRADLQFSRIDEIVATGLHAYLTQFLDRVGDLGYGISRDFLMPA